ncbi:MAG: hypothetical protein HZA36_02225 [Parcubacteria group bacterium]|nr:hypothetical protein [Parcubacteria group bacterium]
MKLFLRFCIVIGIIVFTSVSSRFVSAAEIFRVWYDTQSDGSVIQSIMMKAPQRIGLSFGYCNPQTCGNSADPDFDCYVGLYNPNFGNELIQSLDIKPLPGSQPRKVFLKAGSLPGFIGSYGYYDKQTTNDWNKSILSNSPTIGSDGSVSLRFTQPSFTEAFHRAKSGSGRICGLNEEEYRAFGKRYGSTNDDNFYRSYIRVSIVWSPPSQYAGSIQQNISFNGQNQNLNAGYGVPPEEKNNVPAKVFRQDDKKWGDTSFVGSTIAKAGTVPSTVASLLSQYGIKGDPAKIAQDLEKQGISTPKGTDWNRLKDYLSTTHRLSVRSSGDMGNVTSHLVTGPALVAYTRIQKGVPPQESALLVTGWNPNKDSFTVVDPRSSKPFSMSYDELMKGNPWFGLITKNK